MKTLYEAADAFRKTCLWNQLWDTNLFAVGYPDGEIGYCSVMGRLGEHYALAVYMGPEGLASYCRLAELGDVPDGLRSEILLSEDCLMCSFESKKELDDYDLREINELHLSFSGRNAWPMFRRYRPYKLPWFISDESERKKLLIALLAGMEINRRIPRSCEQTTLLDPDAPQRAATLEEMGFFTEGKLPLLRWQGHDFTWSVAELPETLPVDFPSPRLTNQLAVARLQRLQTAGPLIVDLVMSPSPVAGDPPYFPMIMIMLDPSTGTVESAMVNDYSTQYDQLLGELLSAFERTGKPGSIHTSDPRLHALLDQVAGQIGVPLIREDVIPMMEQIKDDLRKFMESGGKGDRDGGETDGNAPAKKPSKAPKRKIQSRGVCAFCGKVMGKTAVLKHMKGCENRKSAPGEQEYFILRVEGWHAPEYFLYLDVMANTTLRKLDEFLRDIWLECCGHLSVFTIYGDDYFSYAMEYGDLGMNHRLNDLVEKGMTFRHEYDMGTPTQLKITVAGEYRAAKRRNKIVIMARNEAPEYLCVGCGQPATQVCVYCGGPLEESAFCDDCAGSHECGEEAMLPIVNSPRCGQCAYGRESDDD